MTVVFTKGGARMPLGLQPSGVFTKTGLGKKLYPTVYEMTLDQIKAVHFLIAVEAFENFC